MIRVTQFFYKNVEVLFLLPWFSYLLSMQAIVASVLLQYCTSFPADACVF